MNANGYWIVYGGINHSGKSFTLKDFVLEADELFSFPWGSNSPPPAEWEIDNNQPPVAEADFIPIDVEEDEGLFEIVATATDPDDNLESVVAVIVLPALNGLDIELKVKDKIKIEFDLEEGKVEIKGPDPEALLAEITEFGGFLVENGQIIKVEVSDDSEYELKFKEDGTLKIEAPEVTLLVTAADTEGESDTDTASLVFTPEDEE